jgi:hypothetical protein
MRERVFESVRCCRVQNWLRMRVQSLNGYAHVAPRIMLVRALPFAAGKASIRAQRWNGDRSVHPGFATSGSGLRPDLLTRRGSTASFGNIDAAMRSIASAIEAYAEPAQVKRCILSVDLYSIMKPSAPAFTKDCDASMLRLLANSKRNHLRVKSAYRGQNARRLMR